MKRWSLACVAVAACLLPVLAQEADSGRLEVYAFAAEKLVTGDAAFPFFHRPDAEGRLCMPVEFSVAAYRVGHTLVRSTYAVNRDHLDIELFDPAFGLRGFDRLPEDLVVDWRYLLPVEACV